MQRLQTNISVSQLLGHSLSNLFQNQAPLIYCTQIIVYRFLFLSYCRGDHELNWIFTFMFYLNEMGLWLLTNQKHFIGVTFTEAIYRVIIFTV